MATTQLSDLVIVPELFNPGMINESLALDAFVQSNVIVRDAEIDAFLNGPIGGATFNPRFFAPLAGDDPNISTDDPTQKSVPGKITGIRNTAVRQSLNKSWSSMDLSADLNGQDPIGAIQVQVAKYWLTTRQKRLLLSCQGVVQNSVLNHQGDMVTDITGGTGAAALINPDAVIDARGQLGDRDSILGGMIVHSTVRDTMRKLNMIDTIPYSIGLINMPSYLGLPLLVDDGMTVDKTDPANPKFYTYFFGQGAVALGIGTPRVPVAVERIESAGNGGGQEVLHSRVEWVIHPQGFKFKIGQTPTPAQLKDPANWERAFERNRIPLACLITKG